MKSAFLPIGLLVAIGLVLLVPGPGALLQRSGFIPVFVVIIFFINGWYFRVHEANLGFSFAKAFGASIFISLLIAPFLGLAAARLIHADAALTAGFVVIMTVPVTLSSAVVMSEISGGNQAWALFLTIGLNLCGIFTIPIMLPYLLEGAGSIEVSSMELFLKLIVLVLLPFLGGMITRKLLWRVGTHPAMNYVPSLCVVLTVYAALGGAHAHFMETPLEIYPSVAITALALHLVLMALGWVAARILRLQIPERNTLLFITSQKTLPVALSVLIVVAPEAATALIPCLFVHVIQLLVDSIIAPRLAVV